MKQMKPAGDMTRPELRDAAFEAIRGALGRDVLERFIVEFVPVAGRDYTRDRHKWLPKFKTMEELSAAIKGFEADHGAPIRPSPAAGKDEIRS